jgi:hypothetical protein
MRQEVRMHMATVDELLSSYRSAALTEREKGAYFERLSRAFLLAKDRYQAVLTWVLTVFQFHGSRSGSFGTGRSDILAMMSASQACGSMPLSLMLRTVSSRQRTIYNAWL